VQWLHAGLPEQAKIECTSKYPLGNSNSCFWADAATFLAAISGVACHSQPVRPPEPEILNLLCPMLESLTHNPVKTHAIEHWHDGKRQIPEQVLHAAHLACILTH